MTTSQVEVAADTAAKVLADRTGVDRHDVAVVLGSGWRPAADVLCQFTEAGQSDGTGQGDGPGQPGQGRGAEVPMAELPGFRIPSAVGHGGTIRSLPVNGRNVLIMLGRTHGYEGHGVNQVVHGVRTAAAAGCRTIVLTNAAGGLRQGMYVGQPVLISDHLNLTASSPLVGARFVDLTDLYSPRLRSVAKEIDPSLEEGVYAGLPGPHFETPAEIRMLRTLGADLVGMSTVLEAIAARAEGVEVFGLSLVTNLAAGITGQPLNHEEVIEAGRAAATRMGTFLARLVARA